MNISETQLKLLKKFKEYIPIASGMSDSSKKAWELEVISLLSLDTGVEYPMHTFTSYFSGQDKPTQIERAIDNYRKCLVDQDYYIHRVSPVLSVIMDSDIITGIGIHRYSPDDTNLTLELFSSCDKLVDATSSYYDDIRYTTDVRPAKRLVVQPFGGGISDVSTTTLRNTMKYCADAFYPYFDITPSELWDEFAQSDSNVLVMLGPPGTGKTSFIREMLDRQGWEDVYVADDHSVLVHEQMSNYVRSIPDGGVFVVEDADILVSKREDGNRSMSGILNATEGILKSSVKWIISTNLPTTRDIDPALIRHGRAFGVYQFQKLTHIEANHIREEIGLEPLLEKSEKTWTLAEAINLRTVSGYNVRSDRTGKIGFS